MCLASEIAPIARIIAVLIAVMIGTTVDAGPHLQPWKESEFALPATLSERDGGAYRVVDYRSERDIKERDFIDERRVRKAWVSMDPLRQQKETRIKTSAGILRYFSVGKSKGASIITIYLHGQGGSRKQGADDWSFGGNFNRIKNLMTRNGGLYLCPDVATFGDKGVTQITELLEHSLQSSPGATVIVACGSAGGRVGHQLMKNSSLVEHIGGFLLLGSFADSGFLSSPAFQKRVPVYLGHGSNDSVSPVASMENFYRTIRSASSGYPVRMVRFETGSHGTPIRMTNWRDVLNWMVSN